jgi:signal transduction protein with GAF and PtsI domain
VSKFDLRDVSKRLSESRDTEAVVYEFLGYLQSLRPDWQASLAFYEVSRDTLASLYLRDGAELVRRDLQVPVEQLPARLVRKFFHPGAFTDAAHRRSLLASLFKNTPFYEPEESDAQALRPLIAIPDWESCICMPLADQEDLLALLVMTSRKKNAFGARVANDLVPVKSMAALALAQHLYRAAQSAPTPTQAPAPALGRASEPAPAAPAAPGAAAGTEFQEQIRQLDRRAAQAAGTRETNEARLEALSHELEIADRSSSQYRRELERVKEHLQALEEQSTAATAHLNEAYSQLTETQDRTAELRRTVGFLQDVFQMMSQEHDAQELAEIMVLWFSENFGVERCSLMVVDEARDTLRIAAQRGIDPLIAASVRVRVGQGISGWVAHNRKPLFVRVRNDATEVEPTGQDVYNSDSFITVPLVNGDQVVGVLNLSNKSGGLPFDQIDLGRAMLTGSLLAMSLGADEIAQRAQAWG